MHPGFHVPAPGRGGKKETGLAGQPAEVSVLHSFGRERRMQVNGHVKRLRHLKYRGEARVIQEHALGGPMEEGALKSQLAHATLEFGSRLLRFLQSKRCKAG